MNIIILSFAPVSAGSTYKVSILRNPREEIAGLSWRAKIQQGDMISLGEDGTLEDYEFDVDSRIEEPIDGSDREPSFEFAHALVSYKGISGPGLLRLFLSADTFASLADLAERGRLPSLRIYCVDGHGLENVGAYGSMKWDTTVDVLVPVKHIDLIYTFAGPSPT